MMVVSRVPPSGRGSTRRSSVFVFAMASAAVLVVAGSLSACGGGGDESSSAVIPTAAAATTAPPMSSGETVYARSCARCHGAERQGKRDAPALDATRIASLGDQRLEQTIRVGKGRMEGFPDLTDAQVEALMNYLKGP